MRPRASLCAAAAAALCAVPSGPASAPQWAPGTTCTTVFADGWPGACWRPYAATSPFNRPLPPQPRLATNSARIVRRLVGDISKVDHPQGLVISENGQGGEPTYFTRPADPVFTIDCTVYECPAVQGDRVRIPAGARIEADNPEWDAHVTVVDPQTGEETNFWGVSTSPVPATGGRLEVRSAGRGNVLDGDGRTDGRSSATAAMTTSLAGRVRAEELLAGEIRHALAIVVDCDNGGFVHPAQKEGRGCTALGRSPIDAPPMGTHLQLAMSDAEIDALRTHDGAPVPMWRKAVYRAMARYGMFVTDTGTDGLLAIETETGSQYTALGRPDKWLEFARANRLPQDASGDHVGLLRDDAVDWAGRLRVIDPCISRRTC